MKKWRASLRDLLTLINFDVFIRKVYFVFGLVLLLSLVSNVAVMLHRTAAPHAIVYTQSNDAGRAIKTAMETRWYNSNHFAPYGNLYFRFAHTLAKLTPASTFVSKTSERFTSKEKEEVIHHYALMLTSLLSLTAMGLFLAFIVSRNWSTSFYLAAAFVHLGTFDPTWVNYLYTAHPDHLLMVMVTIASYFLLRFTSTSSRSDFVIAALLWGVATAVKRSTILFIPGFLFIFLSSGLRKESVMTGIKFAGYMLLAYLVVGFPQNFGFYKHTKFLLHESHNSQWATLASIRDYLELLWSQTRFLLPLLIGAHFIFPEHDRSLNFRFIGFVAIGFFFLLAKQMMSVHDHHVMPYAGILFVTVIFTLKRLPSWQLPYQRTILFVTIAILMFATPQPSPTLSTGQHAQLSCREEAFALLDLIKGEQGLHGLVLAKDPYFPFDSSKPELNTTFWGTMLKDVDNQAIGLYGAKRGFANQYLSPPAEFLLPDRKATWNTIGDFYRTALDRPEFTTPSGLVFKKIYEDTCGLILWKRTSSP